MLLQSIITKTTDGRDVIINLSEVLFAERIDEGTRFNLTNNHQLDTVYSYDGVVGSVEGLHSLALNLFNEMLAARKAANAPVTPKAPKATKPPKAPKAPAGELATP